MSLGLNKIFNSKNLQWWWIQSVLGFSFVQAEQKKIAIHNDSIIVEFVCHVKFKKRGGVHSSRIECKGVQLTKKTGTSSPISSKMFRSIHPENKNIRCSLTFFNTFLFSCGCSHTFFRKWTSFNQVICVTLHPYI